MQSFSAEDEALFEELAQSKSYLRRYHLARKLLETHTAGWELAQLRRVFRAVIEGSDDRDKAYASAPPGVAATLLRSWLQQHGGKEKKANAANLLAGLELASTEKERDELLLDACVAPALEVTDLERALSLGARLDALDALTGLSAAQNAFLRHSDNTEVLRWLVGHGVAVNAVLPNGDSLWGWTATLCALDGFVFLLEQGANAQHVSRDGTPLLHRVFPMKDGLERVAALVRFGAELHAKDARGCSLVWSALQGHTEKLLPSLVRFGFSMDEPNAEGKRPLATVVRWRNVSAARALVAAGASIDALEAGGSSALMLALQRGDQLLLQALVGEERAKELFASRPQREEVERLQAKAIEAIRKGASHYNANKEGFSELVYEGGTFVLRGDGDGGPWSSTFANESDVLKYLYDNEVHRYESEIALWRVQARVS